MAAGLPTDYDVMRVGENFLSGSTSDASDRAADLQYIAETGEITAEWVEAALAGGLSKQLHGWR